jgi:hypothetical protein
MKYRVLAVGCFATLLAAPAMAADVSHYICRSGEIEKVENSKELLIYAFIEKGLAIGQIKNEAFHAMNSRCVGLVERKKLEKGANIGNGYCKYADKDGDGTVLSWKFKGKDRTWQFISGTGKWKGISGNGHYTVPVRSKSMFKGTFQNCVHVTGSYKLAP